MGEGALLADPRDNLARRVTGLEQRPKVVAPRAAMVRPVAAGLGGFWSINVTSATFVTLYRADFDQVSHRAAFVRAAIANDPGTSSEVRVSAATTNTNTVYSATYALGAGLTDTLALGWIHGFAVAEGPRLLLQLQVRRSGGAGNVAASMPVMMQQDPVSSTPAGAWYPGGWLP